MAFTFISLGSGSGGNCSVVRSGRTTVLVDIGFSARETARRLRAVGIEPETVEAVLITHEHSDHVAGAPVFSRRYKVPILCRPAVAEAARLEARGPLTLRDLPEGSFDLGDLRVTSFPVPHDAVETVGFILAGEGVRLGYATDMGEVDEDVVEILRGCHLLAVEANHDIDLTRGGPYPWHLKERILGSRGHLSNEGTGDLLARAAGPETVSVTLAHLSETNNRPELALMSARDGLDRCGAERADLRAAAQAGPGEPVNM